MKNSEEIYKAFRKERLVDKSLDLSFKITKQKQQLLTNQPKPAKLHKTLNKSLQKI